MFGRNKVLLKWILAVLAGVLILAVVGNAVCLYLILKFFHRDGES